MDGALDVLLRYGYLMLFGFVLAEQVGLPIPAVPVLMGVGALAGAGQMSVVPALAAALVASLLPDVAWYELGRRRGKSAIGILCWLSLEPDSCVRRTETLFMRQGQWGLLGAKFLPGLSTIAPPLAGVVGVAWVPFLLLDSAGALIWAGAWIGLGYTSSGLLAPLLELAARVGQWSLLVAGVALAGWVLGKLVRRQRFLRTLRIARIAPEELKRLMDAGDDDFVVIDTRSALDVGAAPYKIPGALWIAAEDIDRRRVEIPLAKKVVLYCS